MPLSIHPGLAGVLCIVKLEEENEISRNEFESKIIMPQER